MCIPASSKNVKLAHAWINFCMEEEVAEKNSIAVGYTSGYQAVMDKLAETEFEGKTNSFIPIKSKKKLEIGTEYLFLCESVSEKGLSGTPIEKIED